MKDTLPSCRHTQIKEYCGLIFNIVIVLLSLVQIAVLAVLVLTRFNSNLGFGVVISRKISWDILVPIFLLPAVLYNWRGQQKVVLIFSLVDYCRT